MPSTLARNQDRNNSLTAGVWVPKVIMKTWIETIGKKAIPRQTLAHSACQEELYRYCARYHSRCPRSLRRALETQDPLVSRHRKLWTVDSDQSCSRGSARSAMRKELRRVRTLYFSNDVSFEVSHTSSTSCATARSEQQVKPKKELRSR